MSTNLQGDFASFTIWPTDLDSVVFIGGRDYITVTAYLLHSSVHSIGLYSKGKVGAAKFNKFNNKHNEKIKNSLFLI